MDLNKDLADFITRMRELGALRVQNADFCVEFVPPIVKPPTPPMPQLSDNDEYVLAMTRSAS